MLKSELPSLPDARDWRVMGLKNKEEFSLSRATLPDVERQYFRLRIGFVATRKGMPPGNTVCCTTIAVVPSMVHYAPSDWQRAIGTASDIFIATQWLNRQPDRPSHAYRTLARALTLLFPNIAARLTRWPWNTC